MENEESISIEKLSKDLRAGAKLISATEARFLVDAYYIIQEDRKRYSNQEKQMEAEPHELLSHFASQSELLEEQIKIALDIYSRNSPLGKWAREQKGIGPVITAGLLAHIDITKAPTVGHIWRFAGLDPTSKWEKGKKIPWNASLKTLCWKIGRSFVFVSGHEDAYYAQVYLKRKEYEVAKNAIFDYKAQAEAALANKNFKRDTIAKQFYEKGQLPPAHIDQRARRYAVKLFLSHYHEVAYKLHYGTAPPLPYPIAALGHAHKIELPKGKAA